MSLVPLGRYVVILALTVASASTALAAVCEPDRTRHTMLFEGYDAVASPQWSPDGRLIVFGHHLAVYSVESDGLGLRRLSGGSSAAYEGSHSPNISPDGSRVAYAAFKHDTWLPWIKDYGGR